MGKKKAFDFRAYLDGPTKEVPTRTLAEFKALLRALKVSTKPQYSIVHIAGSNGKGSTAATLEAIFLAGGYRTALYTSPALVYVNERYRINGQNIDDESLEEAAVIVSEAEEKLGKLYSGFDRMTAVALLLFQQTELDYVVLETGMGGRLDPTTAMTCEVSMITSIGLDHTELLGNTCKKIAKEKAAIIKKGQHFCVLHPQSPEVTELLEKRCEDQGVLVIRVADCQLRGRPINKNWQEMFVDLPNGVTWAFKSSLIGSFQWPNIAAAALCARSLGMEAIEVEKGVRETFWPARLEQMVRGEEDIPVWLDGAHNTPGVQALVSSLRSVCATHSVVWIAGIRKDKDARGMLEAAKDLVDVFLPVEEGERYIDTEELTAIARELGIPSQPTQTFEEAFAEAKSYCEAMEEKFPVILVAGSLYLAGHAREWFLKHGYHSAALEVEPQP